uniref:1-acyl-sn-glycerol-3-phosphate acyltransferase epsilon-like n=1 Tax=Styela clava TaxID=7725 RepID=UPI001939CB20|nr:1-acyl-sn-glycerol-3-phosphate acyltransferase epsilon-like [Styela clava]
MLLTALAHLNNLRPIVPTAALVAVSPTIFIVHSSWRLVSTVLPRNMFYPVEDAIWGWYQKFVVFVFEACTGVEIIVKGDIPDKIENVLMICNHQTAMDWIVADFIALRQGMIGHMRFVFKNILKYFPLYGYVWGVHGGIFVRRDGTYNAMKMKKTLKMLMDRKVPLYLVIYPEGTRFCPGKTSLLEKSRAYASENRLEPLNNVLTPRIKAFHCAISTLGDYLDAVYDATFIYEFKGEESSERIRHIAPSMWDFLAGKCSRVFIQFNRIPASEVPVVDGMESPTFQWLHMRFKLKDNLLKRYYSFDNNNITDADSKAELKNRILQVSDMGRVSPIGNTIAASVSLVGLTLLLLSSHTGRMVYATTAAAGTVFGLVYAHLMF